ncbi:MAG TPA: TetR/AcrR family transcriptional regulator [Ktedonobacteraceae bacterium]
MDRKQHTLGEQKQCREERRDALENRQTLLQTAATLFTERGVEVVTMTDIAKAAGLGQGTLYRHFAHKGALCDALIAPQFEQFQREASANFGYAEETTEPLHLVHLFLVQFAHFIEDHTAYLQIIYAAYQTQRDFSFYQCSRHQWNRERVKYYLQNAVRVGACRADLDCDYLADALLAVIQIDLYLYHRHTLGWSVERIMLGLSQLLEGLAPLASQIAE